MISFTDFTHCGSNFWPAVRKADSPTPNAQVPLVVNSPLLDPAPNFLVWRSSNRTSRCRSIVDQSDCRIRNHYCITSCVWTWDVDKYSHKSYVMLWPDAVVYSPDFPFPSATQLTRELCFGEVDPARIVRRLHRNGQCLGISWWAMIASRNLESDTCVMYFLACDLAVETDATANFLKK